MEIDLTLWDEQIGIASDREEWFPMLEAPSKDLVVFERSGHRPLFEQPRPFTDYMVEEVLTNSE